MAKHFRKISRGNTFQAINGQLRRIQTLQDYYKDKVFARYNRSDDKTVFQRSGFLDENGKALTYKQLIEKYGDGSFLNYKLKILLKMTEVDYIDTLNETYKNNIITMLQKMGNNGLADEVESMTEDEFEEAYNSGVFDNIKEKYEGLENRSLHNLFNNSIKPNVNPENFD